MSVEGKLWLIGGRVHCKSREKEIRNTEEPSYNGTSHPGWEVYSLRAESGVGDELVDKLVQALSPLLDEIGVKVTKDFLAREAEMCFRIELLDLVGRNNKKINT